MTQSSDTAKQFGEFKESNSSTDEKIEKNEETTSPVQEEWMIRRCAYYDEEYSDCTSYRARFNQYFIFGKTLDCSQWKKDSINCYKWRDNIDIRAANELVESEKDRRKERLLPHYRNDVWMKRTSPPRDWNKPLPLHIQQEYEYTYLNVKSREIKGEVPPSFDMNLGWCSIM